LCFAINSDTGTAESGELCWELDTENFISFCCAVNSDSGKADSGFM